MAAPWQYLLSNFALVALIISVWTQTQDWTDTWNPRRRNAAFGLLMGIGAAGVMLFPFELHPGVVIDLRTPLIAIAGLFGGPVAAAISAAIGIICRVWIGGPAAWAGFLGLAMAAIVGLLGHFLLVGKTPSRRHIALFSAAAAAVAVFNFFALPQALWAEMFTNVALPLAFLLFVSTAISVLALVQEKRRREISRTNHLYRSVIDALPDCLNIKDVDGRFLVANPATARLMEAKGTDDLIGRTDFDFYPYETARTFRDEEEEILAGGQAVAIEQKLVRADGAVTWLSTLKAPIRDDAGAVVGLITHNRDVTDRKSLEIELQESRNRLSNALTNMTDGLVMFDGVGRLVFCNEQYHAFFRRTADIRVPGASLRDILRIAVQRGEQPQLKPEDVEAWIDANCAALLVAGDREFPLHDGRWLQLRTSPSADGSTIIVLSEITRRKIAENQLMALNRKLELLATTDGLTELTNRRGFDQAIVAEFARGLRSKSPLSVLFMDIDRFKAFNDIYGHLAGDEALKVISRCLRETVKRPSDIAARYGGEELVAILPDTNEDGALSLAEAFRLAVRDLKIAHKGSDKGVVTVSIGVATREPGNAMMRPGDLLNRADTALYGAKTAGRDRVNGWRPRLEASA